MEHDLHKSIFKLSDVEDNLSKAHHIAKVCTAKLDNLKQPAKLRANKQKQLDQNLAQEAAATNLQVLLSIFQTLCKLLCSLASQKDCLLENNDNRRR